MKSSSAQPEATSLPSDGGSRPEGNGAGAGSNLQVPSTAPAPALSTLSTVSIIVRRAQVAVEYEESEAGCVVGGDVIIADVRPARGGFQLDEALHDGVRMVLEQLEALRGG